MSEPDPLNRLSRVANQPEQPALEFSDRLLEELLTQLVADQTGPTGPSFDHTINDKATEVIMLSPDTTKIRHAHERGRWLPQQELPRLR